MKDITQYLNSATDTKHIGLSLANDQYIRLKASAVSRGVSLSAIVRAVIRQFLDEESEGK